MKKFLNHYKDVKELQEANFYNSILTKMQDIESDLDSMLYQTKYMLDNNKDNKRFKSMFKGINKIKKQFDSSKENIINTNVKL